MPLTIARRRTCLQILLVSLIPLGACNDSSNGFPNDPVPGDPQTGTTTPNTQPPATIPPPPPTTPPTGPDTEAPRVQMLLPAQDDSITGATPVMADATDNVGVTSVQFLVDNKLLGTPDTVSPYWLQFDTSYLTDGTHAFSARASDAAGNRTTATAHTVKVTNSCKTASPALTPWQNTSFTGAASFTIQWDVTPLAAGLNASVGLSHDNAASFGDLATEVHFNASNTIDARNDGAYTAETAIAYQPNQTYHIRMNVNLSTKTYSVFVAPAGAAEQTLAANFAFRTEQQSVSSVNRWAVGAQVGALKVCGASVEGNKPPDANAGPDQKVSEGTLVTLDGSKSTDSDGTIVSWRWQQTAGPPVVLIADTNSPLASFTAPQPLLTKVSLDFQLTVTDNRGASASDTVRINVEPAAPLNTAPIADAGPDQGFDPNPPIFSGDSVVLAGSGSDPDVGDQVTDYNWTQSDSTPYRVMPALPPHQRIVTFVAPDVPSDTTLIFQLAVTDTHGAIGADTVNVLVRSRATNLAPVANAGPDQLGVPEGTLVTLKGSATDPDGDAIVSYVWSETPTPTVTLVPTPDPAIVTFIAPQTASDLIFVLTATDARGASGSDSVKVTVASAAGSV